MKRIIIFAVLIFTVCSVLSCQGTSIAQREREAKEEAIYQRGYDAGYADAELEIQYEIEEEFRSGYDSGYYDGYYEAEEEYSYYGWLEDAAIHYAREYSSWSPEEAMGVIRSYQNNKPLYDDTPPSKEEYIDAIESLYRFYEYFYCAMYE